MNSNALESCDSTKSEPPPPEVKLCCRHPLQLGWLIEGNRISNQQLRACIKKKATQEDYRCAIVLLNQLIIRDPESAIDYNNRGLMYFKQGDYQQAMEDFNQAIALNSHLDQAYNNRANCYVKLGYLMIALKDYETALDLNPYNQKVSINKGITLRDLEEYDLALETFDFALILGKTLQGRIYAERGYTYHLRGDWNCAIADYRRSLANLPEGDHYHSKVQQWLSDLIN
ncbi:MAG TPA: hypothetical protein DCF68_07965 [Cyanothece sp. UBA12306]|nr:hypothetical protein [Cyanothece sp. UBA12306]